MRRPDSSEKLLHGCLYLLLLFLLAARLGGC